VGDPPDTITIYLKKKKKEWDSDYLCLERISTSSIQNHLWSPIVLKIKEQNKIKHDSSNDFHEMSYQVLLNNTNASLSFRFKILIEKEKAR
jgi:hypothetical protein